MEQPTSDWVRFLLRYLLRFAECARRDAAEILGAPWSPEERANAAEWSNDHYALAGSCLGVLYVLEHADNPLRGDGATAELARDLTDVWAKRWEARKAAGLGMPTTEWYPLVTAENLVALDAVLDDETRARWTAFIDDWAAFILKRPYGFTSPNHEAWRNSTLLRAGCILGRDDWVESALFQAKQELTYQTPEGFWEEGIHHGPSMKYNHLMLAPLAWLYRLSGDEELGASAQRLARFMARYTFPDGTTVGAFDGRQSTSPAFFSPVCPGLELTPEGATLNDRGCALWERLGRLDDPRTLGSSNWYAYCNGGFCADALLYYVRAAKEKPDAFSRAPLEIDADGATAANATPAFGGTLARRGPWAVALSSQRSDIPRQAPNVFRLERESRIEIWHEEAGLVVGGGHSRFDADVPYANAFLDTGHGTATDWGRIDPAAAHFARAFYMPRAVEAEVEGGGFVLKAHFAHGTVAWRVAPEGERRLIIEARVRQERAERLTLQLPLVLYAGDALLVDGKPREERDPHVLLPARETVTRVPGGRGGFAGFSLRVPDGFETRVRAGLSILRTYGRLAEDERFDAPWSIAVVTTQLERPPKEPGPVRWTLAIS